MSSPEGNDSGSRADHHAHWQPENTKRKRISRACDRCRSNKVRCDGEQRPGKRCTICTNYDEECTYVRTAPRRSSRPKGYVAALEKRLARLEEMLDAIHPGTEFTTDLVSFMHDHTLLSDDEGSRSGASRASVSYFEYAVPPALVEHASYGSDMYDTQGQGFDDNGTLIQRLTNRESGIPADQSTDEEKSSPSTSATFATLTQAMNVKQEHIEGENIPYAAITTFGGKDALWECHEHTPWIPSEVFSYPPPDLMPCLISIYFTMYNDYVPLLHRPTFDKMMAEGKHMTEEGFGSVVLLVCALGARWSRDRRVLLADEYNEEETDNGDDGDDEDHMWHSAGWKWFSQVRLLENRVFVPPKLTDVQIHFLASVYLRGSSAWPASRTMIGISLRLALDMGLHRRKTYASISSVEAELMKRTFWAVYSEEWYISMQFGRPCGILHEEIDLDLPRECDDEYIKCTNGPSFTQPPDKPAKVVFFNYLLRLSRIQAFSMRTVHSTTKSRSILGFSGSNWIERILPELDTALSRWMRSIPHHLRWNADQTSQPQTVFFVQSTIIYAAHCGTQISIHKPFFATRMTSRAICVTAARSCIRALQTARRQIGEGADRTVAMLHYCLIPVFNSGVIIILDILGKMDQNKTSSKGDSSTNVDMTDVYAAMSMLKSVDNRWHTAGRLWDMLYEMSIVSDLPLPAEYHAAVVRSTNQKQLKPGAKRQTASHRGSPHVPPVRNLQSSSSLLTRATESQMSSFTKVTPGSSQRSAINQILYPKHAHLFDRPEELSSAGFDLTPSMFTQSDLGTNSAVLSEEPLSTLGTPVSSFPEATEGSTEQHCHDGNVAVPSHVSPSAKGFFSTDAPYWSLNYDPVMTALEFEPWPHGIYDRTPYTKTSSLSHDQTVPFRADSTSSKSHSYFNYHALTDPPSMFNNGSISGWNQFSQSRHTLPAQQIPENSTLQMTAAEISNGTMFELSEEARAVLSMWEHEMVQFGHVSHPLQRLVPQRELHLDSADQSGSVWASL